VKQVDTLKSAYRGGGAKGVARQFSWGVRWRTRRLMGRPAASNKATNRVPEASAPAASQDAEILAALGRIEASLGVSGSDGESSSRRVSQPELTNSWSREDHVGVKFTARPLEDFIENSRPVNWIADNPYE
jgi:hypothetical protein